jgi:hypothetical protein
MATRKRKPRSQIRDVLAKNLANVMELKGWNQPEVARRSRGRLAQRTVGRIKGATFDCSLAMLEALADTFGVQPWQLLIKDLDWANASKLRPITPAQEAALKQAAAATRDLVNTLSETHASSD